MSYSVVRKIYVEAGIKGSKYISSIILVYLQEPIVSESEKPLNSNSGIELLKY